MKSSASAVVGELTNHKISNHEWRESDRDRESARAEQVVGGHARAREKY